jgi:hypothetical protein
VQIDVLKKSIENKYRTVTVPATGENGGTTTKKIIFTTNTPSRPNGKPTLDDSMALHQQEIDNNKNGKGEVILTHLNPEVLRSIKLNWYYACIPVINETDPLAYIMFAKQLGDAINAFGPDSLKVKKLKHKFAKMTGNDFDTWFLNEQELQQKQQEMMQANGGGEAPSVNMNTTHGAQPGGRPSIASTVKNKMPTIM